MGSEKARAQELKVKLGVSYGQALAMLRRDHAFHAWVERVIAVAAAYERRWKVVLDAVREARRLQLPSTHVERRLTLPGDTRETRARTAPERVVLIAELSTGSDMALARLAALAWSGRELSWMQQPDVADIRYKVDHGQKMLAFDGRQDIVEYLAALGALSDYLTRALRHCKQLNLSIPHGLTALAPRLPPH